MRILNSLVIALCVATASLASAAEVYQIDFEMFNESSKTTICTYRSPTGEHKVIEYTGRYFCPRIVKS